MMSIASTKGFWAQDNELFPSGSKEGSDNDLIFLSKIRLACIDYFEQLLATSIEDVGPDCRPD